MFERLTPAARDAVSASATEANLRGDRRIGTDALLLGLLHDPLIASALETGLGAARAESHALDCKALSGIGIDVGGFTPAAAMPKSWRTPFTSGARSVISRAVKMAGDMKDRSIGSDHILLAVLEQEAPDPAAALLAALKVDYAAVRSNIARL